MNFEFAKENMMKQQVLPEGINPFSNLIDAMIELPREVFMPREFKELAYSDSGFVFGGRDIKSPVVIAKLLDALDINSSDNVLELGIGCGYATALFAKLAESVDVVDYCEETLAKTKRKLATLGLFNAEFEKTDYLSQIAKEGKTYNCVYIANIVKEKELDKSLINLLATGGRMIYVVDADICNKAYLVTKKVNGDYDKKFLFDLYK